MVNNLTKMKIAKPASEVFEAFVDPTKIGNFWFSSSSERWKQDRTITLEYKEYDAIVEILVMEIMANKKIVFQWGEPGQERTVTILLTDQDGLSTIVEVSEEGFKEDDSDFLNQLIDNKEGWVFMLTCLKGFLESGVSTLRTGLAK
ncbi:SRPBCC family protein [Psychrobacillus sp. NPDC093180]|uniref:SRPBCC family protein n=1 Tax=Psychrobacillus sp. NPDC093180 TaxID=3364489 RepID=UPI00381F83FD